MRKEILHRSERIYSFLLKFYPRRYRQEFGEEMEYIFSESMKDAYVDKGVQGIVKVWGRTIIDVGKSIVTQHVESQKERGSMKTRSISILLQNKNLIFIVLATACILLIPLIAMQFTNEVAWKPGDFAVAAVLLIGTGFAFELVTRKAGSIAYRFATGIALTTVLILIWANLAVGLIGSEDELANLMYIGVLVVGIVGALIARFQPRGMARALLATALAQVLVVVIALSAGMYQYAGSSVSEILYVNGVFIALWVGSAFLFQRAGIAS